MNSIYEFIKEQRELEGAEYMTAAIDNYKTLLDCLEIATKELRLFAFGDMEDGGWHYLDKQHAKGALDKIAKRIEGQDD